MTAFSKKKKPTADLLLPKISGGLARRFTPNTEKGLQEVGVTCEDEINNVILGSYSLGTEA